MADLLTPSSVTMTTINATAEQPEKTAGTDKERKSKPEKPDEKQYKESLAKAEKEHAIAQEKVVSRGEKTPNMLLIYVDHHFHSCNSKR